MIIKSIGIEESANFPTNDYNGIHESMVQLGYLESHRDLWLEWAGAWNGIAYRYGFCCECNVSYTESIKKYTNSPPSIERYNQEVIIFNFFTNGFSVIECFCYALFAITSIIDPGNFPLVTPKDKKIVTYNVLIDKLEKHFQKEDITKRLRQLVGSSEFAEWSDIRNVLAHRSTPPRAFRLGGPRDRQTSWGQINLDENTMAHRLQWLSENLSLLLNDTNTFVKKYLIEKSGVVTSLKK